MLCYAIRSNGNAVRMHVHGAVEVNTLPIRLELTVSNRMITA